MYETIDLCEVASGCLESVRMTFALHSLGTAARLALVLLVVSGSMLLPEEGVAASLRGPNFHFGNGGGQPHFNIDPDPCAVGAQRSQGRKFDCPGEPPRLMRRGRGGQRGPGSSAFGLQFDNDGY